MECVALFTFFPLPGMLKMRRYPKKPEPDCQKCGNSLNRDLIKWGSARFVKLKWPKVTTAAQLLCTNISKENILGLSDIKTTRQQRKYLEYCVSIWAITASIV